MRLTAILEHERTSIDLLKMDGADEDVLMHIIRRDNLRLTFCGSFVAPDLLNIFRHRAETKVKAYLRDVMRDSAPLAKALSPNAKTNALITKSIKFESLVYSPAHKTIYATLSTTFGTQAQDMHLTMGIEGEEYFEELTHGDGPVKPDPDMIDLMKLYVPSVINRS